MTTAPGCRATRGPIARLLITTLAAVTLLGAAPQSKPRVVAQMYVWVQHYGDRGERLEDHLDEAFAATNRAGYTAVQGWLSWFATPAAATATAAALASHHLSIPAAYVDGPMYDARADATIDRIVDWAARARQHGVETVIMNPDARPDGAEKTEEELAIQARSLDRLGDRLQPLAMSLAVHAHDKEMRTGAREWYYNLRRTDPAKVGICLDVHWVYRGGQDVTTLVKAAGPRIRDLHLRNSRDGIWLEELSSGDIDYAAVARLLREAKYTGTYTVELAYEKGTAKSRPLEEDLRRSRDFVRRTFGL